jgi:hypothetical protein
MSGVFVIDKQWLRIPVFLVGMFFFPAGMFAQTWLSGQFAPLQGGTVLVATYEGYQSNEWTRLRIGEQGRFQVRLSERPYTGFYLIELRDAQDQVQFRFPCWIDADSIFVTGPANGPFEALTFIDSGNQYFQQVSRTTNDLHEKLDWVHNGQKLFTGDRSVNKQLAKQEKQLLKALEAALAQAVLAAPSPAMQTAIRFRMQIDPYLHPNPLYFEAGLLTRINWRQPALYHDPMPAEYVTDVLRHYLFHPLTNTPELQAKVVESFTLALVEATHPEDPLGKSLRKLLRTGLNQIEAWDALAMLDSLEGQATPGFPEGAVSWQSVTHDGTVIASRDWETETYLLVFWSPLCDHCNQQLPVWAKQKQAFVQKGVRFVGVAMDADYLKRQTPQPEAAVFETLLLDRDFPGPDQRPMSIADQFRFSSTPAYFLLGPGNVVLQRFRNWQQVQRFLAAP